jgi:hypothetical protein
MAILCVRVMSVSPDYSKSSEANSNSNGPSAYETQIPKTWTNRTQSVEKYNIGIVWRTKPLNQKQTILPYDVLTHELGLILTNFRP